MNTSEYIDIYMDETKKITESVDKRVIADAVAILREVRKNCGRIFILGVGGGAGHASHAVNDFRKIAGIETYTPADNVSELTAWTNDVGWEVSYSEWLKVSRVGAKDVILVFSVGGGSANTSQNIVRALDYAKENRAKIIGVVSRDGGYTKRIGDAVVLIPVVSEERITPHAEGWQAVVWHLLVNALVKSEE